AKPSRRWWWIAAGGIAVAAGVAALLLAPLLRRTDLDRFWAPLVEASSPVVICMGQPRAYKFEPNTMREVEASIEKSSQGESSATLPSIPFSEIRPVWDRHISLVDAQA